MRREVILQFLPLRALHLLKLRLSWLQIRQVLLQMPQVQVKMRIQGWWEGASGQQDRRIPIHFQGKWDSVATGHWFSVKQYRKSHCGDKTIIRLSYSGGWFNKICHLTSIGNPIVEIRRSSDRLMSTVEFSILVRQHLYIEMELWSCYIMVNLINPYQEKFM